MNFSRRTLVCFSRFCQIHLRNKHSQEAQIDAKVAKKLKKIKEIQTYFHISNEFPVWNRYQSDYWLYTLTRVLIAFGMGLSCHVLYSLSIGKDLKKWREKEG